MKTSLIAFASALVLAACGSSNNSASTETVENLPADPSVYAKTITSAELKDLLYTYASDEFEGRDTGAPGQKLAINFLKDQYVAMGVPSAFGTDNYFQEVPLERQKYPEVELIVNGKSFENFDDFIVLGNAETENLDIKDIVYAGYGIDSGNYSDYKDLDVKGKIVLVKAGEPKDADGNYVTSGDTKNTKWMNGRQEPASKSSAAKEHGAKALIFVNQDLMEQYGPYFKQRELSNAAGRLSLKEEETPMAFIMVGNAIGNAIAPKVLDTNTPKAITTKLQINLKSQSEQVMSENVLAFIKGSEKPDEILVISAHLDHEGIKNGEIYNGADDDGSGTVAIVEIAEAFKTAQKEGHGPKRSILFLHVTGEEKGLLGSKYYTDIDPIFPLKNTVADLNIDMIGRTDPSREGDRNYVYLIGSDKLSTELHNISEAANTKYMNIALDYKFNDDNDPNRFYYRSDHYNFAKNNIPVIFYFNGTHDDYHKPTDTPDKIQYDLLENRARLVFYTAWEVANRNDRIIADKAETE